MLSALGKRAESGIQGFILDDTFRTITKDIDKPRNPGQSDVSYGASKAIPLVTTAIGALGGEMIGGKWGGFIGAAVGAKTGVSIENAAEKRREKIHHISMPTSTNHAVPPPIPSVDPTPEQTVNNYYVYGGPGAGVPRYPYEPVIHPKRGRSHKTHRRKTSR